jgi:hypothetical protein
MQHVPIRTSTEPPTPRELTGKAVNDLINYSGMSINQAGTIARNLSVPTIRRIVRGDPSISDPSLQAMAGVLHLPVNLFLLMIDGDVSAIRRLPMDESVKDHVLTVMSGKRPTPPGSRRVDREGLAKGSGS